MADAVAAAAGSAGVAGQLKIAVLGSRGVGKTNLIERLVGRVPSHGYSPTEGTATTHVTAHTNRGDFSIEFLELAPPVGEGVKLIADETTLAGSAAAILVFDVSNRVSYKDIPYWHRDAIAICEDIPMILVGNKVDVQDRQVRAKDITFHRKKNLQYYDVSAKSAYNVDKALQWLLAKYSGDVNFQLTGVDIVSSTAQGSEGSADADSDVDD